MEKFMVKREIQRLTLTYLGRSYDCSAPASVYSVLKAAGEGVDALTDTAVFTAEIGADAVVLAAKYIYVSLSALKAEAELFLNGYPVGATDGRLASYNCHITDRISKGLNKLEIKFAAGVKAYDAGIFEPIRVNRFNNAIIDKVSINQIHQDGAVTIGINLDLLGNTENVRAVATLVSSTGQIYYGGLTRGKGGITLRDPLYWCPKGFGVQNLYRLTVNLYGENEVEDTVEMRIGLRTAAVNQGSASVVVNGLEILPMGATYYADRCPNFAMYNRKIEALVTSAAMSNYNCILIPSDAPTPAERFYELCDVHGIMVIEEMKDTSKKTLHSLGRRAHHACLVSVDFLGGTSEDATAINAVAPDLAVALWDELPEYTAQPSLPADRTLESVIPEDERNLFSYSMEKICSAEYIRSMLVSVAERYPYPQSTSDFAYASGLASAGKVGKSVWEARMSESGKRAIFGTLGDEIACASPSAVDASARWKPLQYHSMKNFAPLAVKATADGCTVTFTVSNTRRNDFIGTLEYRIVDASNVTIYKASEPCEVAAFTTRAVLTKDFAECLNGHLRDYYLEYSIKEGASYPSVDTLLFVPEKHFKFKKPNIRTEVIGSDRRFSITISADCFVKDLELSFEGIDAVFSENYVDLTSSSPIKISISLIGGLETAFHLGRALRLRSVYDIKCK